MIGTAMIDVRQLFESYTTRRVLAFVPGSFKPPHRFHWDMIKEYAAIADEVQVVISAPGKSLRLTKNGTPISQDVVAEIFEIYKKNDNLNNVKIIKAKTPSPLFSILGHIDHNVDDADIILGTSDKDDDIKRFQSNKKLMDQIESRKRNLHFLDPTKYLTHKPDDNIGGASDMRAHIDDYEYLSKNYLPKNLSEEDKQRVFQLLNPQQETINEEGLDTARVGLPKIAQLNPTAAKRLLTEIRGDLLGAGLTINVIPKTDGQAVRLAFDANDVYIETSHSGLLSNPQDVKIPAFREVLEYYKQNRDVFAPLLKNKQGAGFKVIGELLYNREHVRDKDGGTTYVGTTYDSSKLGDIASIVLFDVKMMVDGNIVDATPQVRDHVINYFVDTISNKDISYFYNKSFGKSITIKATDFSEQNQDNLANLDTISKDKINAVKDELNFILVKHCNAIEKPGIVKSNVVEGLVFEINGKEYAIQNPEWITTKHNFYKYTDAFDKVIMTFIKEVTGFQQRKKILSIFDQNRAAMDPVYKKLLPQFQADLEKAYNDFIQHQSEIPTFVFLNNRQFMSQSYERFMKLTPDIQSFKDALTPIKAESLILEGGNMFDDVVRIDQENVEATLETVYKDLLPKLGIDQQYTAVLGSTGKKLPGGSSGDIDLGIDFPRTNYSSVEDFINRAKAVAKQIGIQANSNLGLKLCSYRWPIANADGKQPNMFVQLDLMPSDNLEMMKWGMYSPHEKDYPYKGTVRNELMNAIVTFVDPKVLTTYTDENGVEQPLELERYSYIPQTGLLRIIKSKRGAKEGKILKNAKTTSRTLVTDNPDKIVKTIFGDKYTSRDCLTGDDLWNLFKTLPIYHDQKTKDRVIAKCLVGLNRKEVKYPPYMMSELSDKSLLD